MTCWWFTTFMAPAIKQKMHNVNALSYLFSTLSVDQDTLELPVFIEEYDMSINGTRYYKHFSLGGQQWKWKHPSAAPFSCKWPHIRGVSPPLHPPSPPFFRENKKQISLMSIRDRRNPVKKLFQLSYSQSADLKICTLHISVGQNLMENWGFFT